MSTSADIINKTLLMQLSSLDSPEKLRAEFEESLRTAKLIIQAKGLTDADVVDFVIPFLKENIDVTELSVANNVLTSVSATELAALASLKTLNISGNPIRDDGAVALAASTTINTLGAVRCQIGVVGTKALAENEDLTVLNLSWNDIGDDGAAALIINTNLIALSVSLDTLSDAKIDELKAKAGDDFVLDYRNTTSEIKKEE